MFIPSDTPLAQDVGRAPPLVVVSLDVEEEGLFTGNYPSTNCAVRNVALLRRLAPLSTELGFPLTLLCAHAAFADAEARRTLAWMRDRAGAEIGAHLHHWSTPEEHREHGDPGRPSLPRQGPPERTDALPREVLRRRLRALLRAGRDFQSAPLTSFRMGRWDLKASVRPLLAEEGILVDSSVCPLRCFPGGPDHFLAPADPYWPVAADGSSPLLEVPITQVPLHPWPARAWYGLFRRAGAPAALDAFHRLAALSPNPVWHSAGVMRMAARLHLARGGRVLSLFWHSSEMLPGASPNIPDQAAADALLARARDFLIWLKETWNARGVTLSSLHDEPGFPFLSAPACGDW